MRNVADVKGQIKALQLPAGALLGRDASIVSLSNEMASDEIVRYLTPAKYKDQRGVLAATDHRLIFAAGSLFSKYATDFPYEKIGSIETNSGPIYTTLVIHATGGETKIEECFSGLAPALVSFAKSRRGGSTASVAATVAAQPAVMPPPSTAEASVSPAIPTPASEAAAPPPATPEMPADPFPPSLALPAGRSRRQAPKNLGQRAQVTSA